MSSTLARWLQRYHPTSGALGSHLTLFPDQEFGRDPKFAVSFNVANTEAIAREPVNPNEAIRCVRNYLIAVFPYHDDPDAESVVVYGHRDSVGNSELGVKLRFGEMVRFIRGQEGDLLNLGSTLYNPR